jgi:MFS transporter, DHA1 family, 2-module integral membrane pump EmrD
MNHKSLRYACFALVAVSYMTLTVSLPLVSTIVKHSAISTTKLHYGISLLFFCFSLSAILLSRAAEIYTTYKTLLVAQSISITGLIIIACATKPGLFFSVLP